MNKAFFYAPHPDDEMLSMGLAIIHYLASGYECHLVSMNNGGALGAANTLNGGPAGTPAICSLGTEHPYIHSPAAEGYEPLTVPDIAAARILEARSALGAMAMMPPNNPAAKGAVVHHVAGLPDGFGGPANGAPTVEGIAAAKAVMQELIDANPNSSHFTMSESDKHPDHAACGKALRQLKQDAVYGPPLVNARFFVSRLYWDYDAYPEVLAAGKAFDGTQTLKWYGADSNAYLNNKDRYCSWLRNQVLPVWKAWNPAAGTYAVGYHQVPGQFINNFAPSVSMANLSHL